MVVQQVLLIIIISYEHSRHVCRQHRAADARNHMPEGLSAGDEGDIKLPIQGLGSLDSCVATANNDDHLSMHRSSLCVWRHAITQRIARRERRDDGTSHPVTEQMMTEQMFQKVKKGICNAARPFSLFLLARRQGEQKKLKSIQKTSKPNNNGFEQFEHQ